MKLNKLALTTLLLALTSTMTAQQHLPGPAPEELLALNDLQKLPDCEYVKIGPHGMMACAYSSSTNLKLLKNVVGEGYEIQADKFDNTPSCFVEDISFSNRLGLKVGLNRTQVLELLAKSGNVQSDTVLWISKEMINDREYDVGTWLILNFNEEILSSLHVFTTTTY